MPQDVLHWILFQIINNLQCCLTMILPWLLHELGQKYEHCNTEKSVAQSRDGTTLDQQAIY